MASNLKTQHLNDGTPIPCHRRRLLRMGRTDRACRMYLYEQERKRGKVRSACLQLLYCCLTGKLCPEGWTVPDWEQTDALPYGSIAQNVALMAPDDNWTALASEPHQYDRVQRTAGRQLVVGFLGKRQRLFLHILHKRQRAGQFHALAERP